MSVRLNTKSKREVKRDNVSRRIRSQKAFQLNKLVRLRNRTLLISSSPAFAPLSCMNDLSLLAANDHGIALELIQACAIHNQCRSALLGTSNSKQVS